jgi:hypothetical protein
MGQDLYVGSLTRYYAHQWETPIQRFARENGTQYSRIGPGADADRGITDPAQVRDVVGRWMAEVSNALSSWLPGPLEWDESIESPYCAEQLPFITLDALRLTAACHEHPELPKPVELPADCWAHEALKRSTDDEFDSEFAQLFAPTFWLPIDVDGTFQGQSPSSAVCTFGSSIALAQQLKLLNDAVFKGTKEDFQRWRSEDDGKSDTLDYQAKWGLALLLDLSAMSIEKRLPMILDF